MSLPWPPDHHESLSNLFDALDAVGRACLAAIQWRLGLTGLMDLLDPPGHPQWPLSSNHAGHENDSIKVNGCSSAGASVLRVYQYLRDANSPLPGLRQPATGLHADMGLLTVSPHSNLPGAC